MGKTALYYFSATGNSLSVARRLATVLGVDEPLSVPGLLVNSDPYVHCRNAQCVGFVFPVQRATIPEMLRGFIKSMPIDPRTYYFAISTYTLFGSNEFWDIDELLASKDALLNYAAGVRMMGNVGLKQPSAATVSRRLEHMQQRVDEIATAIAYRQENFFPRSNKLLGRAVRAFGDRRRRHISFTVDERCTRCGICAQVCPAQNIQLIGESEDAPKEAREMVGAARGAPVRSNRCEACLACVHWCPAMAVSTQARLHVSYHNPTVLPQELHAPVPKLAATALPAPHSKCRQSGARRDPELARALREDLVRPVDIESWLSRANEDATPEVLRFAPQLSEEPGGCTMSVSDIENALVELEVSN